MCGLILWRWFIGEPRILQWRRFTAGGGGSEYFIGSRARGSWGQKSFSGVQGQSPGRRSGVPRSWSRM